MNNIKASNDCKGKVSLINPNAMGGHMEDYTGPDDNKRISHTIRWVPVSESFKKAR